MLCHPRLLAQYNARKPYNARTPCNLLHDIKRGPLVFTIDPSAAHVGSPSVLFFS